ncbi:MAG: DUF3021 domain-containing protein [Oscillospiraceae bacterium]|nr:DUF3021 domain-containing protein [Oscillospiraceae bacterium]
MTKKYVLESLKRGLMAAAGGPVILAIVYGILGAAGTITSLSPSEVCMGILTVTLMAFLAAGVSVVYNIERLPLLPATLIHAAALYADYLLVYLLNAWIPRSLAGIGIFTAIYAAGYAVIWLCILFSIKAKTNRINKKLRGEKA